MSQEIDNNEAVMRLNQIVFGQIIARIVHAGVYLSLPDHVEQGRANAYDIAKKIGTHPESTYRLMRAMSTQGVMKEEEEYGFFTKTPMSSLLTANGPMRPIILSECSDIHYKGLLSLVKTIQTGEFQGPSSLGCSNFWDIHKNEPEVELEFSKNMTANSLKQAPILVGKSNFANAKVVCDLGGSQGILIREVLKANPHVEKGINFDIPTLIEKNKNQTREGPEMSRFQEVSGDFFENVPVADIYTLKFIFHDWSDEKCKNILQSISKANPKAKVYIFDNIIDTMNVPAFGPIFDIKMFHFLNGKERRPDEWKRLAESANFNCVSLDSSVFPGIIVYEPKN